MADKRAYFKTDVGYFTNPKVVSLLLRSPLAVILHLESIAYSAQHLTDGIVPGELVKRLVGADDEDSSMLIDAGMWIDRGDGDIEVHDYLEHQRSAAEVKKLSDAGRKAAESRWQSDSDADGNANRMRNPMPREKEREKENNNTSADAEFDRFWSLYPRRAGKGQAVKAWRSAVKRTGNADLILTAVADHADHWRKAKTERKFIPLPATWLNGERWTDEHEEINAEPDENPWAHLPTIEELRERRGF